MTQTKTSPSAATLGLAGAERATGPSSIPDGYFTPTHRRRQVASFLRVGRSRGVKREDLAAMMGMDERALRRQIQRERQQGSLIISDCRSGYFLPETTEDIRIFVAQMKHRAREINSVCRAAEIALAEAEGQTMMEGF